MPQCDGKDYVNEKFQPIIIPVTVDNRACVDIAYFTQNNSYNSIRKSVVPYAKVKPYVPYYYN